MYKINLVESTIYLYLFFLSIDGLIRGLFLSTSVFFFAYIKVGILLILMFYLYIKVIKFHKITILNFIYISILCISILIALENNISIYQSLFALQILLISIIAYEFKYEVNLSNLLKLLTFLLYLSIFGLVFNYFVDFPWQNHLVNIDGYEITTGINGSMGEFRRLSGFSVSNGVLSFFIFSCFLMISIIKYYTLNYFKLFNHIWYISFVGLILSALKTTIFVFLMINIFMIFYNLSIRYKLVNILLVVLKLFSLVYLISPFFIAIYMYINRAVVDYSANSLFENDFNRILFATMADRIIRVWPKGLSLITEPHIFIFGRGLGGIGVAQNIFEPDLYTSGDSLFIQLLVTIGAPLTFLLLMYFIVKLFTKDIIDSLLVFTLLIISVTHNIIDSPILLFLFFFFYQYKSKGYKKCSNLR